MKAKSIQGNTPEEIQIALSESISDDFSPSLAVVFISVALDWQTISDQLDSMGIEIFGATAEITFTENGMEENGIVILLMEMNRSYFKVVLSDFTNEDPKTTAGKIGEIGINAFSNPAFIISGSQSDWPGDLLMDGILSKAGDDVNIIGGMAGDTTTFSGTLFSNKKSCSLGIISLIIDNDKIDLKGIAVSGWKPVGTEKIVTKSEGPWVQSIDDKPAMDVIWKFIGRDIEETKISETLVTLNTSYPIQFQRNIGSPVMRPTLMYNTETKAVYCGASIKEGSAFRFSLPPDFDVIDHVIESAKQIKENELPEADALLIFSCIGRYSSFGPLIAKENEGLAASWCKPMAGFFSLGEFGKVKGGRMPEFHGSTCSWVALKEK